MSFAQQIDWLKSLKLIYGSYQFYQQGCKTKKHGISPISSEVYEQILPILDIYRQFEELIRVPPVKSTTHSGILIDSNQCIEYHWWKNLCYSEF